MFLRASAFNFNASKRPLVRNSFSHTVHFIYIFIMNHVDERVDSEAC